jgi:hypothetical protein
MGFFRVRRSFGLFPGLRFNLSKSGVSVSAGVKGMHYTVGPKGTRTTVGLPGSGLSYTDYRPYLKSAAPSGDDRGWFRRMFSPAPDSPAPDTAPVGYSELEAWKLSTKIEFEQIRLKEPATRSDNVLTGDHMKGWLEDFEKDITHMEWTMKLALSLDDLMLETSKHCFIIRSTVVESLQALDFVAVTTADGGSNLKEDVIGVFTGLADTLEGQNDNIRNDLKAGVAADDIWSWMRPRGRANITTKTKKIVVDVQMLFEPGKFIVEWKDPTPDATG